MNLSGITVHCRTCGQQLTRPLAKLENLSLVNTTKPGQALLPEKYYITGVQLMSVDGSKKTDPAPDKIEVNLRDVIDTKPDGVRKGCCGAAGLDGVNTLCLQNHPIGTESSDCWNLNHMSFDLGNVVLRTIEVQLPENYENRCLTLMKFPHAKLVE